MSELGHLGPQQMLVVLANIDARPKLGWDAKRRVLGVIATYPAGNLISIRDIAPAAGNMSTATVHRVTKELVEDRVLLKLIDGAGRRGTAWAIQPQIDRWQGVPWLADPRAVLLSAFHVAPARDAKPVWRRDPIDRDTSASSVANPYIATQGQAVSRSHASRRNGDPRIAAYEIATQAGATAPVSVPTGPEAALPSSLLSGAARRVDPSDGAWRALRQLVIEAAVGVEGRRKFLNGPPEEQLHELYAELGADQVTAWLLEAPANLGVPKLIEWLDDQRHRPDPELLEQIEERRRAQAEAEVIASGDLGRAGGGIGDAPDPPPRLQEYSPPAPGERANPATVAAALRAARERSTPSESTDDRMSTTTGGTP